MLDLSAQAIIYEVATVTYMVRLLESALSCPLVAWAVRGGRGGSSLPQGQLCLLRDPPGPGPTRPRPWPTAPPPRVIGNLAVLAFLKN